MYAVTSTQMDVCPFVLLHSIDNLLKDVADMIMESVYGTRLLLLLFDILHVDSSVNLSNYISICVRDGK